MSFRVLLGIVVAAGVGAIAFAAGVPAPVVYILRSIARYMVGHS